MKKLAGISLLFVLLILFSSFSSAQTESKVTKNNNLYNLLGEQAGITQLSDEFVTRLLANQRLRPFFEKTNVPHLKLQLTDQICAISGGPCVYKGADMKSAHANFDIAKADFNAIVEVLQQAMDAKKIPFHVQNRLLALLAPMHREVITVK